MALHQLKAVAPGQAKTAFYLSGTRSTLTPVFGKGMYGKTISYNIFLYRNGSPNTHRMAEGDSHTINIKDVEINGGREESLKSILLNYNYSHQLASLNYEITKDGKIALEPNYHRPKKPEYNLVRIDAKLMALYDLKSIGVEYIQPYRDRPDVIWSIGEAILNVASGRAPRVFGKMPLSEGAMQ